VNDWGPTLAGIVAGNAYFQIGESGVPTSANCSYLSPVSTDYAALAAGAILAYQGSKLNSPWVSFIGAAIASIHVRQFAAHKVTK